MKKIIKMIFPESVRKILRRIENVILRMHYGFSKPLILKDVFGIKFILYPEQKKPIRWLIERGAYKKEFSAMNMLIKPGGTIFDVGSHIGIVACYLRKLATDSADVHSFEPFEDSYRRLRKNIAINDYENIITNRIALSDTSGKKKFYYEPKNWELNSLGKVSTGENILSMNTEVETETIDNYCQKNNVANIHFLKIDTEGYEINVLRGAEKMLTAKKIEVIQFEISKIPLESLGRGTHEIIFFLKKKAYLTYEYIEGKNIFVKIDSIIPGYDNYYASHKDLGSISG